ncbi:MAG: hypothetical protein IPK27_07565 [Rhodanobacteraceae bacterium]|nr:hypothetical protein [Rhodanobacteraceae bacterium]
MSAVGDRLRALLGRLQQQHRKQQADAEVAARLAALRAWQARRLASTYADIHEVEPFAAACEFFLTDLYGEGDFADRDRAVERVVPIMMRLLPEGVLASLARTIELNALSQQLDYAMAAALPAHCTRADAISDVDYAAAYALSADRQARRRQLALLLVLGRELDRLVRKPMLSELLHMCRWPARLAGLGALQSFLERGFDAFGKLGGAGIFLGTILARELAFMRALARVLDGASELRLQEPNSWSR